MRSRLADIVNGWGISTRLQPIIELPHPGADATSLFAVESLVRGPAGTVFESAGVLFDYVRRKQAEAVVDRECISLALRNVKLLPKNMRVFMNVHATTLGRDDGFAAFLQHQVQAGGIDLRRICLEILDYGERCNQRLFLQNIRSLQNWGVSFALDDLGLQHCNLGMLLDVGPQYLKLDMQLVQGCHADPKRAAIIRAIARLAVDLGATVIAEGVEETEELHAVSEAGIRHIQGFLFAEPMWTDQFLKSSWCCIAGKGEDGLSAAPPLLERPPASAAPLS